MKEQQAIMAFSMDSSPLWIDFLQALKFQIGPASPQQIAQDYSLLFRESCRCRREWGSWKGPICWPTKAAASKAWCQVNSAILMLFVMLLDTGAAAQHLVEAVRFQANHVKRLTVVVSSLLAEKVLNFRGILHDIRIIWIQIFYQVIENVKRAIQFPFFRNSSLALRQNHSNFIWGICSPCNIFIICMAVPKHYFALLLLIALLFLVAESQPSGNANGRNSPSNRQIGNRQQLERQRQNNKKEREDKSSSKVQQQKNLAKDHQKQQTQQAQKVKSQDHAQPKNKQNSQIKKLDEKSSVSPTQVLPVGQKFEKEQKKNRKFQEEKHRKDDEKEQYFVKLIILVILGVIVIVIILLVKPCIRENEPQNTENSNTQDQIADNKYQINQFETFGQHQNNFEKIVIQEKQTIVEIMKGRFLRTQNTQKNQVPISLSDQNKVSTPTFGGCTISEQM